MTKEMRKAVASLVRAVKKEGNRALTELAEKAITKLVEDAAEEAEDAMEQAQHLDHLADGECDV